MTRFKFHPTALAGLMLVERRPIMDGRGFLTRFFCAEEMRAAGILKPVVQINHTLTRQKGAVRGFHFQYPPHAECKVVSCIRGEVFDVAVDLRKESPTLLHWHSEILSAENQRALVIPEGFAHGFQTLTEDCELIYLHTEFFAHQAEGSINVSDPRVSIAWPLKVTDISERDKAHPFLKADFEGMTL